MFSKTIVAYFEKVWILLLSECKPMGITSSLFLAAYLCLDASCAQKTEIYMSSLFIIAQLHTVLCPHGDLIKDLVLSPSVAHAWVYRSVGETHR